MKRTTLLIISTGLFLLLAFGVHAGGSGPDASQSQARSTAGFSSGPITDPIPDVSCTVIYAADGENAFGGNNEDSPYPDTMVWFLPPGDGKFGRALFGYDHFIWQGGVNDQGLFFDALVGDDKIHVQQGDKPSYPGSLPGKALAECADVACVKRMFREYHAYDDWVFQFMFGDASGDSVIIEPETMIDGGAPFQVATNFYQSRTDLNACRYCERYWTARNLFEKENDLSVDLIRDILDEVHLENDYPTQYSTIYDLKGGLIYLYHFHNYGNAVVFDLAEELEKGYQEYTLVDLFPQNPQFLEWAQPEMDRMAEARAEHNPVEVDPDVIAPYLGRYVGPDDFNMLHDYYSIAYERGQLVLKMLPDKAWMKMDPSSESTFFHVSPSSEFEITFIPEENGEVNRFIYSYLEREIPFHRVDEETGGMGIENSDSVDVMEREPTFWSILFTWIWRFSGTDTFKFLSLILGLLLLQALLSYLGSRLI